MAVHDNWGGFRQLRGIYNWKKLKVGKTNVNRGWRKGISLWIVVVGDDATLRKEGSMVGLGGS